MGIREAASRVASSTKKMLEDVAVDTVQMFLKDMLDSAALTVALRWDEVLRRLAERGQQPTTENVLSVLEEMHDKVDFNVVFMSKDDPVAKPVAAMLSTVLGLAKRFASRDLLEKLTYDNVLAQARKRNLKDVEEYMVKYPNLCRKLVEWLRSMLLEDRR